MNRRQKLVQQQFLNDEEKIIKRLKTVYDQSLRDINGKVAKLDSSIGVLQKALADVGDDDVGDLARAVLGSRKQFTPKEAKETLQSMLQSKVYQKNYQTALKKQVGGVLDKMQDKEYKLVSEYLDECYENGFIGTMYDLQGQGIPMCFPLDQEAMVRAVQIDSKISQGLYSRLGEDVTALKKKIVSQVSRGISTGMSYQQVAKQLAGDTKIGFNNAVRIARTEGHRVQVQSGMDACYKAKDKGADVVKQWDATLDGRTRESHAAVDGEIRELDEKFSNGLMYPGDPSGGAGEVINCRCALLQRARWALDDRELETLKKRAEYFGLDKANTFEDYKKKYLKAVDNDWNFRKISGNHDPEDDLVATNPGFNEGSIYQTNCQRCVPTYEMRRRGYDVEALPALKGTDDVAKQWLRIFKDVKLDRSVASNRRKTTMQKITDKMLEYGNGARAEIYVKWTGTSSAHVFVAENVDDMIRFVDPQSGNMCEDYFMDIMPSKTMMFRIDNLEPSDLISKCCKSREKK